jgi:hypothetical protein
MSVVRGAGCRLALGLTLGFTLGWAPLQTDRLGAAEPHAKFLERLREERLFDLGLLYLEDVSKKPNVEAAFLSAIDLERALLQFESANFLPLNSPERGRKLDDTEAALEQFLRQHPKHQRRSEARMKLGGLYQLRAQEALSAASGQDADVPAAIDFFGRAHQLFQNTIDELAAIEVQLRGDRIDANDPTQVAYRERVRTELREAQLLSAKSVEDRGRSRAKIDPKRAADLQQARQMYSDFYSKEQSMIGLRNLALLYRSGVQRELGQPEDAIDGYLRIVDVEGVDALRSLQTEAMKELIGVWAEQGKVEPAIQRAERWLGRLGTNEKNSPTGIALQVELARIQVEWAADMKKREPGNRQISRIERSARTELRGLLRIPGPHVSAVKQLLAGLGVEQSEEKSSSELPKVTDLSQALSEAQTRMDDADALALNLAVLDDRLASEESDEGILTEREQLAEMIGVKREQALDLLREGLRLYSRSSDDRSQLSNARLRMAYLLLKLQRPLEALIVGEALSRASPATPQGLTAASIVLTGYSELLQQEGTDQSVVLQDLTPFAEYLVANWPQSTEAAKASSALTQLAIVAGDWDQAERYLQSLPESDPGLAQRYYELGASLYDRYLRLSQATAGVGEADSADAQAIRERAVRWLQAAADRSDESQPQVALSVATALAALKLSMDQPDQAWQILIKGDKAPLNWLESKKPQLTVQAVMEAYRTAVRVMAAQIAAGSADSPSATAEMKSIVERLNQTASQSEEAVSKLPAILASIARDLKEKLALIRQPQRRAQFSEVVLLVLDEAAKTDSFTTQYWAASSMMAIAEEMESQSEGKAAAQKAYSSAASLLQQMVQRASEQADWASPQGVALQLKVLLAKASEGAGDLRTAIQTYGEVLDENESLLDIQILVARALQKSANNNPSRYESAIKGAKPHSKTGANVFWGWGKIGQVTSRRLEDFGGQFFEARFQLAYCRMQWALSFQDQAARLAELQRAERTLQETISLYPSLGGAEDVKRFSSLLKRIQQEIAK